jgi:hypothetical protein
MIFFLRRLHLKLISKFGRLVERLSNRKLFWRRFWLLRLCFWWLILSGLCFRWFILWLWLNQRRLWRVIIGMKLIRLRRRWGLIRHQRLLFLWSWIRSYIHRFIWRMISRGWLVRHWRHQRSVIIRRWLIQLGIRLWFLIQLTSWFT